MSSRMKNLTDAEIISWVDENVKLRKDLAKHCKNYAYTSGAEECMLIYSEEDFKRLASVLGKNYNTKRETSETVGVYYRNSFLYKGISIHCYTD